MKGWMMAKNFREPSLDDLLDDPLTAVIMARDGVSRTALLDLLERVAERLAPPRLPKDPIRRCCDLTIAG
jgi:hypothetical protein